MLDGWSDEPVQFDEVHRCCGRGWGEVQCCVWIVGVVGVGEVVMPVEWGMELGFHLSFVCECFHVDNIGRDLGCFGELGAWVSVGVANVIACGF